MCKVSITRLAHQAPIKRTSNKYWYNKLMWCKANPKNMTMKTRHKSKPQNLTRKKHKAQPGHLTATKVAN